MLLPNSIFLQAHYQIQVLRNSISLATSSTASLDFFMDFPPVVAVYSSDSISPAPLERKRFNGATKHLINLPHFIYLTGLFRHPISNPCVNISSPPQPTWTFALKSLSLRLTASWFPFNVVPSPLRFKYIFQFINGLLVKGQPNKNWSPRVTLGL